MRRITILYLSLFILACGNDESLYPKSYTHHSIEQNEEGLFLVSHNHRVIPFPVETGSYKTFREELKAEVAEFMQFAFAIQEIELLDENSVHLRFTIEDMVTDTIVDYTAEYGEIIIEALQSSNFFSYNKQDDQFELCSRTQFALPGPNVINPGPEYSQYNISECLVDFDPEAYAQKMLDEYDYQPLDTLVVFISRFIYK